MMDRARSYAGVSLEPFARQDQDMADELEQIAREAPDSSVAWLALAKLHDDNGRTAQAVLAYVRYFMIDRNTLHARGAASRLWQLLVPEFANEPATTSMKVPKDCGDPWWQAELILATIRSARNTSKAGPMPDERFFATSLQGLVTFLVELADAGRLGELWRTEVVPYFRAAMTNGFLESMAYACTRSLGRPETLKWLVRHEASVSSMHDWSETWRLGGATGAAPAG
jgi:hypothetical protein